MDYCSACGNNVSQRIPDGDNRPRHVCDHCDTIHYSNPNNIVGCILEWQGKVLLCKRSIEPRYGYWTLPAGFMENRETTVEGAAREAKEEALADSHSLQLFGLYNLPFISQVYIMYRGVLTNGYAEAGEESLDVMLCDEDTIPWDELAFHVVTETLQRYFEDRRNGHFNVHSGDILSRPGSPLVINRHPKVLLR